MKRIFAVVIAIIMLLSCLVSCSGDGDPIVTDNKKPVTAETTVSNNESTTYLEPMDSDLEALDYGGAEIHILSRSNPEHTGENEMWVEEFTNDPVNDAIYNRNLVVQQLLGVEITEERAHEHIALQEKVDIMVHSDDQTYDIVAASVYYGAPMILQGLVYNLLDNGIDDHLDITKPWWAQYWIDNAIMNDRLYCITGAPALSLTRLMFVTYYNKGLAEANQLEDLYTVVKDGRWTMDYLAETASGVYVDKNGNNLRDDEDTYGILIDNYVNVDVFWSSFDMNILSKTEDGWFELDTGDKEKISVAYDKIFSLIYENYGSYNMETTSHNGSADYNGIFANGDALFNIRELLGAETAAFRNMQDDYGILPTPKFDEKQKEYYTYPHDQYSVFMIPITVKDPVMSGAVLEAMAYESYKSLHPVYYDIVLKGRYANDPQSRQMLDMITANVTVDSCWIYGGIMSLPAAQVMRSPIGDRKKTFASNYAKIERTLPGLLKLLELEIEKMDY